MKKFVMKIAGIVMIASASRADISINFTTALGGVAQTGGTTYADLFTGSSLVQLIWSMNQAYSIPGFGGTIDTASEVVLFSTTFSGGSWSDDLDGTAEYSNLSVSILPNPPPENVNAGYVYARVFDTTTVPGGSYYANSDIYSTASFKNSTDIPKPLADQVELLTGPMAVFDSGSGAVVLPMNLQVVPEPSTFAFLGIGGLIFALRRRRVA